MLVGFVFAIGIALGAQTVFADRVARQATVTALVRQAECQKAGSSKWQAIKLDQKLSQGDKVRTGPQSEMTLTLDDGSTLQLSPESEFSIQSLVKESTNEEQLESILAIMKGKVKAQVTPLKQDSKFEIETPVMVAAVRGTTYLVGINPDGSVSVTSEDDAVDLVREGVNKFRVQLETGDEALVEYDLITGDIKITCVKGTFEVTGPDGVKRTLHEGDSIIFKAGAATYISISGPISAPGGDPFSEPTHTNDSTNSSSASTELSSFVSGE